MEDELKICYYHELAYYTNIYSLSQFDTPTKRGCIINTSKQMFHLVSRKGGEVKLLPIKLNKLHSSSEIEIQAQTAAYFKGFLYIAFLNRSRRESEDLFTLNSMRFRNEDLYTPEPYLSLDLSYVPYKIFLVFFIKREIEDEIFLFVSGNSKIFCKL